jgi:hypothetical protein
LEMHGTCGSWRCMSQCNNSQKLDQGLARH